MSVITLQTKYRPQMANLFPVPDKALSDRLSFLGTSGSGKSYAAQACAEELLEAGRRLVIAHYLPTLAIDERRRQKTVLRFAGDDGGGPPLP